MGNAAPCGWLLRTSRRVVCGKGNNGGDGLVTADALARWGMRPDVAELAAGVDRPALSGALARADVVIDAMYGTGFRGALEGDAAWCADEIGALGVPVVAVDIPSGVDGLTGAVHGTAVRATSTVTFAARKPGLVFEPGQSHAGVVTVADIGIDVVEDGERGLEMFEVDDVAAALPPRRPDAHKWMAGVLVVGGSGGMTGAPMFVSHAAMRAGAGIVWCGLPGEDAARRTRPGPRSSPVHCRSRPTVCWRSKRAMRCWLSCRASSHSRSAPVSGPIRRSGPPCSRWSPRRASRWCSTPTG